MRGPATTHIGFDLDGVFVNDFAPDDWNESALKVMHAARAVMPPIVDVMKIRAMCQQMNYQFMLVTARPTQDYTATKEWMDKNNFGNTILSMNPTYDVLSTEQAARWKAEAIRLYRINVFFESDPMQASLIRSQVAGDAIVVVWADFVHRALANFLELQQIARLR